MASNSPNDDDRHPYRVHVSGLAKSAVHRHDGHQCYDEEYEIGDFFHERGCSVTWVSLLVDKRCGRSRGFAFVDFDDEASFEKACALNGLEHPPGIHLDEKSGGRLHVSPAKPSDDMIRQKHLELTKERNRTDGLEKEMRLTAARINEKMQQIQAQRERQLALQKTKRVEEELHNQRARQREIEELMIELHAIEASLTRELKSEKERTRALEDLHASVHWDEDHHSHDHHEVHTPTEHSSRLVKPLIAPEAEALHRKITVRGQVQDQGLVQSQAESPHLLPPPPSTLELERVASGGNNSAATRAWIAKRDEKEEALKRAASVSHDLSRNILDAKVEALERSASQHSRRASAQARGSGDRARAAAAAAGLRQPDHPRWGDMTDDDEDFDSSTAATSIWGRGGGRRDVRIRNLPDLPDADLEAGLKREFQRLWAATGRDVPPDVECMRISRSEAKYVGKTSVEVIVVFRDPYNAWLLVEHCGAQDWSSSCTPNLHGQLLQVEWPPTPPRVAPLDYRKFNFRADSDASSQLSYNTLGTMNSRSSFIAKGKGAGSAGKGVGKGDGEHVPPQNRTVIIAGVPTMLKEYNVKSEMLGLLQRLYQRNSFAFDPKTHLHKGLEGIEVRPAKNRQDENGGTVKIRFRNYADAAWLVEQAPGLKIAGSKLKTFWAQPRGIKESAGNGKGPSGYPPLGAAVGKGVGGGGEHS